MLLKHDLVDGARHYMPLIHSLFSLLIYHFLIIIWNFQFTRIILSNIDHFRCKVVATENTCRLINLALSNLLGFIPAACHNMGFCPFVTKWSLLLYYVRQSSIISSFKADIERLPHKMEMVKSFSLFKPNGLKCVGFYFTFCFVSFNGGSASFSYIMVMWCKHPSAPVAKDIDRFSDEIIIFWKWFCNSHYPIIQWTTNPLILRIVLPIKHQHWLHKHQDDMDFLTRF